MVTRIKLGELLVRAGVLDEYKLNAALAEQQRWGGRLGKILVEMNFVSEDLLLKALSKQMGIQRATFENFNVPQELLQKLDVEYLRTNALCPEHFDEQRNVLTLAMADPTNVGSSDEIRFKTGVRIEPVLGGEIQVLQAIDRYLTNTMAEGIELTNDDRPMPVNPRFQATMAASGLPVEMESRSPAAVPAPPPGLNQAATPTPSNPPPPVPPPAPTQAPPEASGPPSSALEMASALDGAQKKQLKAIRAMLELLIEKGIFSREEYIALVNKR